MALEAIAAYIKTWTPDGENELYVVLCLYFKHLEPIGSCLEHEIDLAVRSLLLLIL